MDRRTFTPMRLIMVLLVVGLALGIGLAVAQTQSAAQPSADTPKSVAQTQEAAQPSGDTPGSAAEKPDTPETPAASAEAAEAPAAVEDATAQRTVSRMRSTTQAQRQAAARKAQARRADLIKRGLISPSAGAFSGNVDYFSPIPNYAWTKLPSYTQGTTIATSTGVRKFVDGLAGLGPANASTTLGSYIPVASPMTNVWGNGGDYYEIGLIDYTGRFNTDLPATTQLRGYVDLNPHPHAAFRKVTYSGTGETGTISGLDTGGHYLGPVIIAQRDTPVRVKFTNQLTGTFFIPADATYMGMTHNENGTITNYSLNRANMHMHGGATPWISDGTPHQWTVPAGEWKANSLLASEGNSNFPNRGDSTQFVPDMWFNASGAATAKSLTTVNDPGHGSMTFFYTNDQSGRLMFYHDHSYGITRLNVYAGEAAGYLLHDPKVDALIGTNIPNNQGADATSTTDLTNAGLASLAGAGGLYHYGIPLVIQDKTFVPNSSQLAIQDPSWTWGAEGNLWFPHVYMPNQNPNDDTGASIAGRWDLGAWFWPPMTSADLAHPPVPCLGAYDVATYGATALCPATPNPSGVPESFLDTPVVNGVAYPTVTLHKDAYRFQVLNAANDRMFNLSLFYAADALGNVCNPNAVGVNYTYAGALQTILPATSACTEVKMVPAIPHPATVVPETPADADDMIPACASTASIPDVNRGSGYLVMANPSAPGYSAVSGLPTGCWPSSWPTDGRDGGVPDPRTAGPMWVQIGTEGGVLPAPVMIPPTPVGYNYNRRDVVVTNVQEHALFLGPAERADVIADLSGVPDTATLMLYNDSPAPVPGFDTRLDYYTGSPDQTSTGGAPSTVAGFGPNIRTVMQIHVSGASAGSTFSLSGLQGALPGVFRDSQPPIIVAENFYTAPVTGAHIPAFQLGALTTGALPTKNAYPRIGDMNLTYQPIIPPPVGSPVGTASTYGTAITVPLKPKAIHELFENDYGKMNSILAEEIPLTNYNNQTTIPLAYVDPPTDFVADGETQLWKVTHNGVDSHAIHFHLFNVQLINRVGWDGAIRPPDPNEVGWKETVRMNPLEDAFVALKPVKMKLPTVDFGIPESNRLYDVTRNSGATNVTGMPGFTNVDPNGNGVTTVNAKDNFGWEYVWHCHLLGHEESDMMRPIVFQVLTPDAASGMTAKVNGAPGSQTVLLSWSYTQGGTPGLTFLLQKNTNGAGWVNLVAPPFTGSTAAGTVSAYTYTDFAALAGATISYQVFAQNGNALSGPVGATATTAAVLAPPTNLTAPAPLITTTSITLTWTAPATTSVVANYRILRAPGTATATACPVTGSPLYTQVGTSTGLNFRNNGLTTKLFYCYQVYATYVPTGQSAPTAPLQVQTK